MYPTWVAGTEVFEPSPSVPRVQTSRKDGMESKVGTSTQILQHEMWVYKAASWLLCQMPTSDVNKTFMTHSCHYHDFISYLRKLKLREMLSDSPGATLLYNSKAPRLEPSLPGGKSVHLSYNVSLSLINSEYLWTNGVVQWIKPLLAMLASLLECRFESWLLCFGSSSLLVSLGSGRW